MERDIERKTEKKGKRGRGKERKERKGKRGRVMIEKWGGR